MSRARELKQAIAVAHAEEVRAEIEEDTLRPADIPADVWQIVQDNGRLATERLNELLASPRFMRFRPGDQAKLIALAQNRAYGTPKSNSSSTQKGKRGAASDVTATVLRDLVERTTLPEYNTRGKPN